MQRRICSYPNPKNAKFPFAILQDAFLAAKDKNHLLRLAPERAELVVEMLNPKLLPMKTPPQ